MSTLLLIFQHSSKVNYCTGFIIKSERQEGGGRWGGRGRGQGVGGKGWGEGAGARGGGRVRGEGAGGGGGKNYGVECLGGRIDEGYSIGEPRVHLRKGGHYRGW